MITCAPSQHDPCVTFLPYMLRKQVFEEGLPFAFGHDGLEVETTSTLLTTWKGLPKEGLHLLSKGLCAHSVDLPTVSACRVAGALHFLFHHTTLRPELCGEFTEDFR